MSCFTVPDQRRQVQILDELTKAVGLKIPIKKTKVLEVAHRHHPIRDDEIDDGFEEEVDPRIDIVWAAASQVELEGQILERVTSFKYLGRIIASTGTINLELLKRRALMRGGYNIHKGRTLEAKNVQLKPKLMIFTAVVSTNAILGCEIWNYTGAQMRKVEGQHLQLLKNLFGYKWFIHGNISLLELMEKAADYGATILPMEARVNQRMLQYAGHMVRAAEKNTPEEQDYILPSLFSAKISLPPGYKPDDDVLKKSHGQTYVKCLWAALESFGIPKADWKTRANSKNKSSWSNFIKGKGLDNFMRSWYARKRKEKLGRERTKRSLPIDQNAPCDSCGLSGHNIGNDMLFCDGCNKCIHALCAIPAIRKPLARRVKYMCIDCVEAGTPPQLATVDDEGEVFESLDLCMRRYDERDARIRKSSQRIGEEEKKSRKVRAVLIRSPATMTPDPNFASKTHRGQLRVRAAEASAKKLHHSTQTHPPQQNQEQLKTTTAQPQPVYQEVGLQEIENILQLVATNDKVKEIEQILKLVEKQDRREVRTQNYWCRQQAIEELAEQTRLDGLEEILRQDEEAMAADALERLKLSREVEEDMVEEVEVMAEVEVAEMVKVVAEAEVVAEVEAMTEVTVVADVEVAMEVEVAVEVERSVEVEMVAEVEVVAEVETRAEERGESVGRGNGVVVGVADIRRRVVRERVVEGEMEGDGGETGGEGPAKKKKRRSGKAKEHRQRASKASGESE